MVVLELMSFPHFLQILPPYHASLLNVFDNVKSDSKIPQIKSEFQSNEKSQNITNTGNKSTIVCQTLEKPVLPKRQLEDDGVQQPMTGMLYDYQHLTSSLW